MPIQLGATGIRFNDNSVQTTAASGGGLGGTQVFTSSGTFTIPTGKTVVKVTVVGGGNSGANGGNVDYSQVGSGGGAGGAAIKYLTGLTPGNTLTVTRGAAGGTSSVASGTQTITTISATGGSAGALNYGSAQGGAGGSGTNGDWNIQGSPGFIGYAFSYYPGDGFPLSWNATGGQGGSSILGFGGNPASQNTVVGVATTAQAGQAYGAGGGGGSFNSLSGAAGAAGIVIFEY
jgi:hypothetical protein